MRTSNDNSQEASHYVVTAHPAGAVLLAAKCNFLAPQSLVGLFETLSVDASCVCMFMCGGSFMCVMPALARKRTIAETGENVAQHLTVELTLLGEAAIFVQGSTRIFRMLRSLFLNVLATIEAVYNADQNSICAALY